MAAEVGRSKIDARYIKSLPESSEVGLVEVLHVLAESSNHKVVVIDDDSVGTQNLGNASVICSWDEVDIDWLLRQPGVAFVSTGARWHGPGRAIEIASALGASLRSVAKRQGLSLTVVSHDDDIDSAQVPQSLTALTDALGDCSHGTMIVPTSLDSRESTVAVHGSVYRQQGAKFEHIHSSDRIGHTDGSLGEPGQVLCDLLAATRAKQLNVYQRQFVTRMYLLEILAASVLKASVQGAPWTIRSGHSLVPALVGETPRRIGKPPRMASHVGGMVLVGPEAALTPHLRNALADLPEVELVPTQLALLQDARTSRNEVVEVARTASSLIRGGKTAVVYLEDEVAGSRMKPEDVRRVTMRLCTTALSVADQPAYLVIQAGATAHVLAVEVINARRNSVLGPIMSKLAMWRTGGAAALPDSPFLALPYYPNRRDLAEAVWLLEERRVG